MSKLALVLITLVPAVSLAQPKPSTPPAPPPKKEAPPPPKDTKAPPPKDGKDSKMPVATPPAPPPEIAETVGMFKGTWSFDATITATGVPGMDKPFKGKMTFPCKPVAGGNAVACDAKMKSPMGPFDGHFVIAYDPFSKAVHFIGVTNEFEVHDHVCGTWDHGMAGKSGLSCTPLKGGMGPTGDEVTEDLSFSFHKDGKEMDFTSTSKMKNGATMTFEGHGKK